MGWNGKACSCDEGKRGGLGAQVFGGGSVRTPAENYNRQTQVWSFGTAPCLGQPSQQALQAATLLTFGRSIIPALWSLAIRERNSKRAEIHCLSNELNYVTAVHVTP